MSATRRVDYQGENRPSRISPRIAGYARKGGAMLTVAVVGGGIAGAMLAWRLRQAAARRVAPHLFTGGPRVRIDASTASDGIVRGFETDPGLCRYAADSLAE